VENPRPIPPEPGGDAPRVAEIPLFPLDVVLFPNMILPLHIFEERYKEMVQRCVRESLPFGVVLVREIAPGTNRVETFPVGCTARIARVERLPDGCMNIEVIGENRFRILDTHEQFPYRVGLTEPYPDSAADDSDALTAATDEAQTLLREFLVRSLELMGQEVGEFELPRDPEQIAFAAACVLPLSNPNKQEILAERDAHARLTAVRQLLTRENGRLKEALASARVTWSPVELTQYDEYHCPN
jgi:uncharacterized protein